jgi:hypothetical protein
MLKKMTFCILFLLVFISGCTTTLSEKNGTVQGTSAKFSVVSLVVTPIVVEPGQAVTVNVKVANTGETTGTNKVALTINGAEEEARDVTVASGSTQTVNFTFTRDAPGVFDIKVAGLNETLRVKQAGTYPRLGNFYVAWPDKGPSLNYLWHPLPEPTPQLKSLARWDIIVVPYSLSRSAPESLRQLRKLNPKIKILAFIQIGESDVADLISVQSSNESWYLHFGNMPGSSQLPEQRRVGFMQDIKQGFWCMNPASGWSTFAPNYIHDDIMSTGLFDGVFLDNLFENVKFKNIDINNDDVAENPDVVNREYNNGMTKILKQTRELLGPEAIILGNAGSEWSANSPYFLYANGHLQENALGTLTWSNHDFSKVWEIYQRNMQEPMPPSRIHWISADSKRFPDNFPSNDTNPALLPSELQKMRYGLAITLLEDGYFSFDNGIPWHIQLWWFPEYDANLGLAKGDANKRNDGTWMREFQNGMVIVNPTGSMSTIDFMSTYQDVTTGIVGSRFVVLPEDGRIFVATH